MTPHPDVASGRYQQAEFAADLWQVHLGEGSDEYRDPKEFFRRTHLTESLKLLLVGAVQRLNKAGGDPVVQLQTNFGGGKTHSMLAAYHLFSGVSPNELQGVDTVLQEAGIKRIPTAKRVVLVGNKISHGNPSKKADGTVVRTLWGELAWQLGGKKAYKRIQADDSDELKMTKRVPTDLPGMITRDEFVQAYCERMGFTLTPEQWRFYEVFGLFRNAVIAQQIYYRYHHRQTRNPAFKNFWILVSYFDVRCRRLIARAG